MTINQTVTRFSPKCWEITWQHKNGNV